MHEFINRWWALHAQLMENERPAAHYANAGKKRELVGGRE